MEPCLGAAFLSGVPSRRLWLAVPEQRRCYCSLWKWIDAPLGVWILSRWKRFSVSFGSGKSYPLWGVHSISFSFFLWGVAKPEWYFGLRSLDEGWEGCLSHQVLSSRRISLLVPIWLPSAHISRAAHHLPPESLPSLPILFAADWLPLASSPCSSALGVFSAPLH